MKKRIITLNIIIAAIALLDNNANAQSRWMTPNPDRRYDEVCFLTAHNAYAAHGHGYYYAQQRLTIKEQLNAGVRALMLDTHLAHSYHVKLCHRNESLTKIICGGKEPMPLSDALLIIKEFLDSHPSEIITIILENYVTNAAITDTPFIMAGLAPFFLRPADWNPSDKKGWPTLKQLQESNKRLIIFNNITETEFAYDQWSVMAENQWGVLTYKRALKERPESKKHRAKERYLYCVNYFPKLKINWGNTYQEINSTKLEGFIKKLPQGLDGLYFKEKKPNFLSIDFIDEGDAMKLVNEFNQEH